MSARNILMAAGGSAEDQLYADDVFSAYTYTGNSSTQTINNGIDFAGEGGLVWCKQRSAIENHVLFDSARGAGSILITDSTGAQNTGYPFSLTSTGFSLGSYSSLPNTSGGSYASWTFRKAPKFFDVVTWTGNDLNPRVMNHSLGASPGMMIVKTTSGVGSSNWNVYHRSLASPKQTLLTLNTNDAASNQGFDYWIDQNESSFIPSSGNNFSGRTYVAYLFAHDPSADGIVQCGSYVGGSSPQITLGWEPQYLLIKRVDSTSNWWVNDASRKLVADSGIQSPLFPNLAASEANSTGVQISVNATGFQGGSQVGTYIYLAIRRPNKPPTTGTEVYNAIARTGTGDAATVTGVGFAPDLVMAADRGTSGRTWWDRLRGAAKYSQPESAGAEGTASTGGYLSEFGMDGYSLLSGANGWVINVSGRSYINHFFRRAPGFMDVVCYTGDGVQGNKTRSHNLGTAPELIITKQRTGAARDWHVNSSFLGSSTHYLFLNSGAAQLNWGGAPCLHTASTYDMPGDTEFNQNTVTYVSYLFASAPGISKVFSYTGNGTSQTINCGFTTGARFFLVKSTSTTGSWWIFDTTRGIISSSDPALQLNSTAAEITSADAVDPEASGLIVNQEATCSINATGVSYVFLAIS